MPYSPDSPVEVVKKSSCGEMIGPAESEGSISDAIRNLDLHASRELKAIAEELLGR